VVSTPMMEPRSALLFTVKLLMLIAIQFSNRQWI
jgi:hypothetical protein